MTRFSLRTSLLALTAGLLLAGSAHGAIAELAPLGTAAPGCPGLEDDCRIGVVKQTVFQSKVGTTKNFTSATANGTLVAWTVGLAAVPAANLTILNAKWNGAPRVGLVILTPLGKGQFRVVRKSPMVNVTPYLGSAPTFALPAPLPITKGQIIGLTVPSWAPILQLAQGSDTSWRGTRKISEAVGDSTTPPTQRALIGATTTGDFTALYQRARVVYSAAFVPTPVKTKSTTTTSTTKK